MTTTIRDVAKRAGVGLGTVSRVLNNGPLVSPATRQRVLDVIKELDYVPSAAARRFSLGKTLTITVVSPWFTRPAEIEILRGIENTLSESEYDLILYNVETPRRRDAIFTNFLRRERTDGALVLSTTPRADEVDRLARNGMPVVFFDATYKSVSRVVVDDVAGGRLATQHLIDLGHRRIGYISDPLETAMDFRTSRNRYQGYRQALEAASIPFCPDYHSQGEHGRYEARRLANLMLALPERPTAIFAASDTQALGVLEAAQDSGLRVPEDLSVIGYDDIELAEYVGLTTIRQFLYEMGKKGVEILLDMLADPAMEPVCGEIPTELIVRKTTAPLR